MIFKFRFRTSISLNKETIEGLKSTRAKELAQYKNDIKDLNNAISAISEALPHLKSLISADDSSFIQKNSFIQMNSKLENSLLKVNKKHSIIAKAVSQIFLSKNFVNQNALKNIIKKLEDLSSSFGKAILVDNDKETEAINTFTKSVADLNKDIKILQENTNKQITIRKNLIRKIIYH